MKASKKTRGANSSPAAEQKDSIGLPSHDALSQILPGYLSLPTSQSSKRNLKHTYQIYQHQRCPVCDFEDDPCAAQITDLQTKEVQNYRSAMSRMAADIITLRTQLVTLEAENRQLHSYVALQQDLGRDLLSGTDIDVMTKAEVADHIALLTLKLASETSAAAAYQHRIHQLQNELIKKNDSENELLKLKSVKHQQQKDRQHHQIQMTKTESLQATVKQQGKVIEKMEKTILSKTKLKNKQSGDRGLLIGKRRGKLSPVTSTGTPEQASTHPLLCCEGEDKFTKEESVENSYLRGVPCRARQQPPPVVIQQLTQKKDNVSGSESLALLTELEQTNSRLQILEKQLEENSKSWGKQKQQMLIKLNEHKHGFSHTSKNKSL